MLLSYVLSLVLLFSTYHISSSKLTLSMYTTHYTYMHIHVHTHIHMHVHIYKYMYIKHICIYMLIYVYINTNQIVSKTYYIKPFNYNNPQQIF